MYNIIIWQPSLVRIPLLRLLDPVCFKCSSSSLVPSFSSSISTTRQLILFVILSTLAVCPVCLGCPVIASYVCSGCPVCCGVLCPVCSVCLVCCVWRCVLCVLFVICVSCVFCALSYARIKHTWIH